MRKGKMPILQFIIHHQTHGKGRKRAPRTHSMGFFCLIPLSFFFLLLHSSVAGDPACVGASAIASRGAFLDGGSWKMEKK
jgi:hypothetical protein